jgi:hypothetical protein
MLNNLENSKNIIYAGKSERRILALKQLPGVKNVFNFNGGPEKNIGDVRKITHEKMDYVLPQLDQLMGSLGEDDYLVAADSRTEILSFDDNGNRAFESKGKPYDLEDVLINFQRMSFVAKELGFANYQVRSASALLDNLGRRITDLVLCGVDINKSGIDYLSSERGFDEYIKCFHDFYSSEVYSTNQLSSIGPQKISAGVSLPVLRQMGMVKSVNKVEQDGSREAVKAFRLGLWTVAVGFGPSILERVHPDAMATIIGWDWLDEVTKKVVI